MKLKGYIEQKRKKIVYIFLKNEHKTDSSKGVMFVREIEVVIDTEDIAEFFYEQLVSRGFVPSKEELEELADITFDYLLEKCMIDELFEENEEDD